MFKPGFRIILPFILCFPQSAIAADTTHNLDETSRLWQLGSQQHEVGAYVYKPILVDDSKANGFEIQKRHRKSFYFRVDSKGSGACWPVEPIATKSRAHIPVELDRTVESIVKDNKPKLPLGYCSTGDGNPNLIVAAWTGGAHCCFDYRIFSLGPRFKYCGIIHGLDSEMTFTDLDNDGVCEAIGHDFNFRYWNTSFAYSPAPLIILTLKGGTPRLAISLMKTPPLTPSKMRLIANELIKLTSKENPDSSLPKTIAFDSEIWKKMLELIYTGNARQAWEVFDLVWPKDAAGDWISREKFIRTFNERLRKSQYWSQLRQLNGGRL